MNSRERYEEMDQQFNGLPLPDQEQAWQKMKQKLDEDKDRRRILPPVFLNCLGWGLVILAGLTAAWFFLKPEKASKEKAESTQTTPASSSKNSPSSVQHQASAPDKTAQSKPSLTKTDQETTNTTTSTADHNSSTVRSNIATKNSDQLVTSSTRSAEKNQNASIKTNRARTGKIEDHPQTLVEEIKEPTASNKVDGNVSNKIDEKNDPEKNKNTETTTNKTAITVQPATKEIKESPKQDTAKKEENTPTNHKPQTTNHKHFFIAAGIGEQQQIPIAGQTAVPYSHYGRKGSLSDYVPSLYVRLQKENKWFVQTEFRFGAAQSVREFSYNRQTKFDTASNSITTTTLRLKKTYYHQLPVTFNYFITKNLSVGIGAMYSRFYGAITEQEVKSKNIQTQAEVVKRQIVPIKHFTDSFLYKTQVHALLQADYQWRRFTFGLRYTKDVQPYIKYTNPDGTIDERKNQSLQFIMRFRILQSKKF